MNRLEDLFRDAPYADDHAGPSPFPPPATRPPISPAATELSHDPFPYRHASSSAPSSPRPQSSTAGSSALNGIYNDPRSRTYVRFSLNPPGGDASSGTHQLADRHVRGQVVRKAPKPARGGAGKSKASAPEAGLDDGSAGVGSVLVSMGRGPEGSGKAVVVGNDVLRLVQFVPPTDLKPLPPPPHWIPLTFSASNFAPPLPSSFTSRPAATALPAPYNRGSNGSNNSRRRSVPNAQKMAQRAPADVGYDDGTVIGQGPGGVALKEIATLRGLRDATGGSGVVEARWGWGGQSSRVFVSGRKGNVMVWDVNSPSKMHSDIRVDPTRRPISVMRFGSPKDSSPTAASMVTGGHDSILRLYDFRSPSSAPALSHSLSPALTSPITALAVSPASALHVVLGLENGTIGWIDWRRAGRLVNRKFSAHGEGGVMSLDWKDGGRGGGDGWIASAGLDKKVHVWNMEDSTRPLHRTLRCAQPVSEVLWRPGHETEIAVVPYVALSGSNAGDEPDDVSAVQIWDVRRGHLPKFVLEGGDGAATGIAWNDHGSLWAAYKTGTVIQHDVRHHSVPLQDLPGTNASWTADGHLAFSAHRWEEGEVPFDDPLPSTKLHDEVDPRRLKSMSDAIYDPDQVAVEVLVDGYASGKLSLLAGQYRFSGKDPKSLCRKNAKIAEGALAWQDVQVWRTLEGMVDTLQKVISAAASPAVPPPTSALQDIPDLHLPPPRASPVVVGRGRVSKVSDDRAAAAGPRGLSLSPLVLASTASEAAAPGRASKAADQPSNPATVDYANAFAVRLNLAIEDSDIDDGAVDVSSDSEDIESSSSSSSEDQLQTIPIPRQSRSKRGSFSSRRPSSSSQTRPNFSSPLGPHTAISASLPSRQASPHPNPRSYLRQFQDQMRASPPQKAQSNGAGAGSDSDDDTPQTNSPQLSDDAYGVDPYGTGYGHASILSTTSSRTVTGKTAAAAESQPGPSRAPARAPLAAKSSPKLTAIKGSPKLGATLAGSRSSAPVQQSLPGNSRTRRPSEQQVPALANARPARVRQVEQMTLDDLRQSSRRALNALIDEYLDAGNPQMPSLIFILCKDLVPLSRRRAAHYVTAYYKLLMGLKLYVCAAKLRKHCDLPAVQEAVRRNTTTYLSCPRHSTHALPYEDLPAPESSSAWCLEEKKPAIVCCFCSKAVYGALAGCDSCGHGGHWLCMERWWKTEAEPIPSSLEQGVVRRADTPPANTHGSTSGNGSDSSPTTPARFPLAYLQARSEASGENGAGAGPDGAEAVAWGWLCPTGCGCRCAVSHMGPPPSLLPWPAGLPITSQRSSVT